jgi:hypothetical protein
MGVQEYAVNRSLPPAPAMKLPFRMVRRSLELAEWLVPEKMLPDMSAEALIAASGVAPSVAAREGVRQLAAALRADSELTMFGRLSVRWDFIRLLRNAAKIERIHRENPSVAGDPIVAPIFILGLPRSGTTFLHELLAKDASNLVPRAWQTINPEPRPRDFNPARDKRVRAVNRQLRFFGGLAPEFPQLHPIDADSPQECSEITAHVFQSLRFDTTYRVPEYQAWLDARGHQDAFAFHKRFLQVLQQGTIGKRWVLKCPDHSFCLDAIMETYPDARFIVVHRDPMRVFASVAYLTEVLRQPFLKNIDPGEIGHQVTERWIDGAQRLVGFDQRADIDPARKIHVHYDELTADPMATVVRIYRHLGLPITGKATAAINGLLVGKSAGGYGGEHRYAPERFGIHSQHLAAQFTPYMDYFHIAV